MLVPVIFIVAMVVRATHSLKGELANGTLTVTIEDFDKVCESSGLMHRGEPKTMGEKYVSLKEEETSRDTESLFWSILERLCPYVGYFPVKVPTDKVEPITKKDTFESEYHIDDKTITTSLSTMYFNISDTTDKNKDALINSTSELTSTTENIIKPMHTSDEMITDTELDLILTIRTESTVSTPKDTHHSSVDEKPAKIMESTTMLTTPDKPDISITVKYRKTDSEMTETTLADSSFKNTTYYSSIYATPTISVERNSTINDTVLFASETTKTTSYNTLLKHKDDLIEEVENSTIVATETLKLNSEPTVSTAIYETDESSLKENMASTTSIGEITKARDLLKHKQNTGDDLKELTSTIPFTKNTPKEDVTITTDKIVVSEKDSELENTTELIKLPVHTLSTDDNDYLSSEETSYETLPIYYFEHTNDELIAAEVVNDYNSAKFDEDHKTTTDTDDTDRETSSEDVYETETTITKTTTQVDIETESYHDEYRDKIVEKVTYKHDTDAVDKRRYIIVILFVSILLVLSLIWAVKILYRKYNGSYELPQEGDNDMELGDNSTEDSPK